MTIEEHKEHLLDIIDSMPDDACGDWRDSLAYAVDTIYKYQKLQSDYEDRLNADMVVILDKIRTEIKALTDGAEPKHIWNVDVLAIIDKYKAESEGKE